jgi:hypothetical protein
MASFTAMFKEALRKASIFLELTDQHLAYAEHLIAAGRMFM